MMKAYRIGISSSREYVEVQRLLHSNGIMWSNAGDHVYDDGGCHDIYLISSRDHYAYTDTDVSPYDGDHGEYCMLIRTNLYDYEVEYEVEDLVDSELSFLLDGLRMGLL